MGAVELAHVSDYFVSLYTVRYNPLAPSCLHAFYGHCLLRIQLKTAVFNIIIIKLVHCSGAMNPTSTWRHQAASTMRHTPYDRPAMIQHQVLIVRTTFMRFISNITCGDHFARLNKA